MVRSIMDSGSEKVEVRRSVLAYEAYLDDQKVGDLAIARHGDVVTALHTEVEPDAEGQGVGSALARALLDDARSTGRRVEVKCLFVAGWLKRHPEYQDVVVAPSSHG
jgi:predicted GNAT family acetyltransferase